jgi:hypothetical protein
MLKTEAVKKFLLTTGNRHLTDLYEPCMELQVNVGQDGGTRTGGVYNGVHWSGWTDGTSTWKSFRVPWGAGNTESVSYTDSALNWNLEDHAEGIGMTGWDYVNRQSHWVGFDFDSIANHKVGLSVEELESIRLQVTQIPWVTLVKSTSGKGLHIYVHLDNAVGIGNHGEHAALSKSILCLLSQETGYNFQASVDTCGGILWVYHRKQEGTDGLALLKQGEKLSKLPSNWRDYIEVAQGKKRKLSYSKEFETLIQGMKQQELDADHKRLLKWFCTSADRSNWWDSENNMLVCHTLDLAKAHKELKLMGFFATSSSGSSDQNCFCFPSHGGSWMVRRHSLGVKEHQSWVSDPSGWTRSGFNAVPEFESAAKNCKGIENIKGDFVFSQASDAFAALLALGLTQVSCPEGYESRPTTVGRKIERILVRLMAFPNDKPPEGYLLSKKEDHWEAVFTLPQVRREVYTPDNLIRHIICNSAEAGWYIHARERWIEENRQNIVTVLNAQDSKNAQEMMSKCILSPWEIVNIPFESEYPGNRQWNKDSAKLAKKPEEGNFSTWIDLLSHIGANLNSDIIKDRWCIGNGVRDGGDYLLLWVANMFMRPYEPLPYLFLTGEQNSGKSTFHEALELLFLDRRGYARADLAVVEKFNSQLAGAVLAVIEETDLRKNKEAYSKIKDWVTSRTISINTKFVSVYDVKNTLHFIHCTNDSNFCPVFPGDTRITAIYVNSIPASKEIPKLKLLEKLNSESAAFLHHILNLELPESEGRLSIPCIHTDIKSEIQQGNMTDLELFIDEKCYVVRGKQLNWDEFYWAFIEWLPSDKKGAWSTNRAARAFPKRVPLCKGKIGSDNITVIGNLSLTQAVDEPYELFTDDKNRIGRRMYASSN